MNDLDTTRLWQRFDLFEQSLCLRANRGCHYPAVRKFFTAVSRLGDGVFWYLLMLAFAVSGEHGATVAAQMAITGLVALAVYRQLKHRLVRERPYISHAAIQLGTHPRPIRPAGGGLALGSRSALPHRRARRSAHRRHACRGVPVDGACLTRNTAVTIEAQADRSLRAAGTMATDRLIQRSLAALRDLRDRAVAFDYRSSARNLLHYLSIRQTDIRELQQDLHSLGLSSLGVLESNAMAALNAVIGNLEAIAGVPTGEAPAPPVDFRTGRLLLRDHARRLFGPAPRDRMVRIMVTMPSAAATDARLIEDLLRSGMDLMRINCAHDDAAAWRKMAANLRHAEQVVGRKCAIQADLGIPPGGSWRRPGSGSRRNNTPRPPRLASSRCSRSRAAARDHCGPATCCR